MVVGEEGRESIHIDIWALPLQQMEEVHRTLRIKLGKERPPLTSLLWNDKILIKQNF